MKMTLLTVALVYVVALTPLLDARGFYAPYYRAITRNAPPQHNEVGKHSPTQPPVRSTSEQNGAKQSLRVKPEHGAPDELLQSVTRQEKGQGAPELLWSMAEQLRGLQNQMGFVKFQSQRIWRQLKKLQRCDTPKLTEKPQRDAGMRHPTVVTRRCPPYFTPDPDSNKCFRVSADRVTWQTARDRCRLINADLVAIETRSEQQFINELAGKQVATRHCDFWIGATTTAKSTPPQWYWTATGGAVRYENWNVNEPNNSSGWEHCAQMLWLFQWQWNDAQCNYGNACYICQTTP